MSARSKIRHWLAGSALVALVTLVALVALAGPAAADGKKLGNGIACTFNSDCESNNCSFKVCKKR